jgi:hypothetical protein
MQNSLGGSEATPESPGFQSTAAGVVRHRPALRAFGAVVCGIIAGALIPSALAGGCSFFFPAERTEGDTWLFFWGEHWAMRVLASWASSYGAGFIAGMVARRRGMVWAGIAALPSTLCWLMMAVVGWIGWVPFVGKSYDVNISIGNKLAASLLVITIIPFASSGGLEGENLGSSLGDHFDSRRFTLLGIKWYHYFWLPVLIQLLLIQVSYSFLYGFEWLRSTWRSGLSLFSLIPGIFSLLVFVSLSIMIAGAEKCYLILSGFDEVSSTRARAVKVLKYGFGFPLCAVILEVVVEFAHYGLLKLLGHGSTR